jgi:hypothetical protein
MESYQTWFGEGPELSVLRILGLFDRPADEKALGALLKPPPIPGLTESLIELSSTAWRTILARLRRARLLAPEDPHDSGQLDTHPLVREYFGEQLRSERIDAWKESNKRLYTYYRTIAPQLPAGSPSQFCTFPAKSSRSPRLGAQRFRRKSRRHFVDRGRNRRLSGNRLEAQAPRGQTKPRIV